MHDIMQASEVCQKELFKKNTWMIAELSELEGPATKAQVLSFLN